MLLKAPTKNMRKSHVAGFERHLTDTNLFAVVMEVSQPQKTQWPFVHLHPRRQRMWDLVAIIGGKFVGHEIHFIYFFE